MPEGESVSMTAVPEARTWNLVFTAMPWPSLPSQSPERDCSFLKAAECVPAHSGAAMDAASRRSTEYLRRVTDASGRRTARQDHTELQRRDMSALTPKLREWKQVIADTMPRKNLRGLTCGTATARPRPHKGTNRGQRRKRWTEVRFYKRKEPSPISDRSRNLRSGSSLCIRSGRARV